MSDGRIVGTCRLISPPERCVPVFPRHRIGTAGAITTDRVAAVRVGHLTVTVNFDPRASAAFTMAHCHQCHRLTESPYTVVDTRRMVQSRRRTLR